jgi:uncharacterized protein
VIYLDTAAVIKLLRPEAETPALRGWLNERQGRTLVASALIEVELPRALRRADPGRLAGVPTVLQHIARVEIDSPVRATAAAFEDPMLRSLDAIHLATAMSLIAEGKKLEHFVTYDTRLLAAARDAGLTTVSPT